MGKKIRVQADDEVPIAAMIDVVFLLLCFFIMTANDVVDEANVSITLPGPPSQSTPNEEEPPPTFDIFILGSEETPYNFQNRPYTQEGIDSYISQVAVDKEQAENMVLNIKVSLDAKHKKLINLVDVLKKYGIEKINILSLKEGIK